MTKYFTITAILSIAAILAHSAPPAAITMRAGWTGAANEFDFNTANYLVDQENTRLAALDPPGTPLLKSTDAELKASTTTILEANWQRAWESYGISAINAGYVSGAPSKSNDEVRRLYRDATDTGRAAAIAALEANQAP
jgi:hypothetical protein